MAEISSSANFFGSALPANTGEWAWELVPADVLISPTFNSRLDAQAWLGEHLSQLRTAQITAAQLTHQGRAVGRVVRVDEH